MSLIRGRRFRTATVVALTGLTALSVTACSSASSASKSDGNASVTIAIGLSPRDLDPCDTRAGANSIVLKYNVLEALTKLDLTKGTVDPYLATSWTQLDPTHWEFKLRQGVKFHDGTEMDAAAVVKSLTRSENPKFACSNYAVFSQPFKATAKDSDTVDIDTVVPTPILPSLLTFMDISSPNTPDADKTQDPIGTGPYKFVSYTQDQNLKVARFDGYWGPKPQITSATYQIRESTTVRASMVKTGEADIAMNTAPQDATQDGTTKTFDPAETMSFRPNNVAPLDNLDVRHAISMAIDRDTLANTVLKPIGKPTNQMLVPSNNGYIKNYQGLTYDPNGAKALIAKAKAAGSPVDTPINLIEFSDEFPGSNDAIAAVAQMIENVGLKVQVKPLDNDAWSNERRNPFRATTPELIQIDHNNFTGDAATTLVGYMAGGTPNSYSTMNDAEFNSLFQKGVSESDPAKRAADFQQAAARGYDLGGMIPYQQLSSLLMLSKRVSYTPDALTILAVQLSAVTVK